MKKHTGLVLKSGTWFAYWMAQGKRYSKSTGETDLDKAIRKREEFMRPYKLKDEQATLDYIAGRLDRVNKSLAEIEEKKPGIILPDVWQKYLDSDLRHFSSERAFANYERYWKRLLGWLNEKNPNISEMREITLDMAKEFCAEALATLSSSSYNMNVTFFKHLFSVLKKEAKLTDNIWDYIKKKKKSQHTRRELTAEELKKVLNSVDGEMKVLFSIGMYTGLRLGDCAKLKWQSVNLRDNMISLVPSKTRDSSGKRVDIPIHQGLKAVLENIKQDSEYVMPEIHDLYLRNKACALSARIQNVFKSCGIKTQAEVSGNKNKACDVGFHSLRHTFVSICANSGVPMAIVQALVGHSNPSMTQHYFHENTEVLKKAIQTLPKVGETKLDKTVILERFKATCEELAKYGLLDAGLEILKNTQPKTNQKEVEADISVLQDRMRQIDPEVLDNKNYILDTRMRCGVSGIYRYVASLMILS